MDDEIKQQKGISTLTGILVLILIALIAGAGVWAYYHYKILPTLTETPSITNITPSKSTSDSTKKSTAKTSNDATAGWRSLTLNYSKGILKYPNNWKISKSYSTDQINSWNINYNDNTKNSDGYINEFKIMQWLKGPGPDEGYVLNKQKRSQALALLNNIYNNRSINNSDKAKFSDFELEFFTYSPKDLTALTYIESKDGKSRGFSALNSWGQAPSIDAVYKTTLYNQENNVVISISYRVPNSGTLKSYNNRIDSLLSSSSLMSQEEQIHTEFKNYIESTPRAQLDFGSLLNNIDLSIKSLAF